MAVKITSSDMIKVPENYDKADVEYTWAIIKYKHWTFTIYISDKPSSHPTVFDIKVSCDKLDGDVFLWSDPWYVYTWKITSLQEAVSKVRDFINNDLQ